MVARRTRRRQRGGANCDDNINGIAPDIVSLTKQINGLKTEKPTNSKEFQTKFIDAFWENIFNPFKKQIMDDPMCKVSPKLLTKLGKSLDSLSLSIAAKNVYLTNFFQESYKIEIPAAIQAIHSHILILEEKNSAASSVAASSVAASSVAASSVAASSVAASNTSVATSTKLKKKFIGIKNPAKSN